MATPKQFRSSWRGSQCKASIRTLGENTAKGKLLDAEGDKMELKRKERDMQMGVVAKKINGLIMFIIIIMYYIL